jgi:hypothetical protein
MCFNEKVSLFTFILGMVSSIVCYRLGSTNSKIVGVFFGFVILMQLIEYLLWRHQECDSYNESLTKLGMILNNIQPVVLFMILTFFNKKISNKSLNYMALVTIVYSVFAILYSFQLDEDECTNKSIPGNKHLIWKWNFMDYYFLFYSLFILTEIILLYLGIPHNKHIFITYWLFTIIISKYMYSGKSASGAIWCFFAAFTPFLYVLFNGIKP